MDDGESYLFLLFDIDGTLIRSAGAGRTAMERAFRKIYGVENGFENIHMMGRTDPGILMEALKNHGLEWQECQVDRFKKLYFQKLEAEIKMPREAKRICPGILPLLGELRERSDVVLGLLTGNWRTSGYIKLRHFRLDEYFSIGAFGDDSYQREAFVPIVMERLEKQQGIRSVPERVFVIGDTPLDVRCAKPHGVKTVAVATGFHTVEQLTPDGPDFLFQDFSDTEKVMAIFDP